MNTDIIKENCNFKFYKNKTDISPTVLDGGNEIILAKWPNDKHIIYNINSEISVRIPRHAYVFTNRSVLCNCGIEADNHYLLESLAVWDNANFKLTMYFTVNTAFMNYLDMFSYLIESLEFLIIKNRTPCEQTLPVSLNISKFDKTLLTATTDLKQFINSYTKQKEIFDLQERHDDNMKVNTNKNFFSYNYIVDIFMFISALISLLTTALTVYLLCKHKKLRALTTSLVLHKVKEVGAEMQQTNSKCRTLAYIGIILTVLSLILVTFLHYRKSKFCKGQIFKHRENNDIYLKCTKLYSY